MRFLKHSAAAAAAVALAAQPCLAAEPGAGDGERRSGFHAGLYARVPLGQPRRTRDEPRAGLRFGITHLYRGVGARAGERRARADMVDLAMSASGRPSLLVAGRQLVDTRGRLALQEDEGGGGVPTWAIVAGGAVVGLGIGYWAFTEAMDCDADEECS